MHRRLGDPEPLCRTQQGHARRLNTRQSSRSIKSRIECVADMALLMLITLGFATDRAGLVPTEQVEETLILAIGSRRASQRAASLRSRLCRVLGLATDVEVLAKARRKISIRIPYARTCLSPREKLRTFQGILCHRAPAARLCPATHVSARSGRLHGGESYELLDQ